MCFSYRSVDSLNDYCPSLLRAKASSHYIRPPFVDDVDIIIINEVTIKHIRHLVSTRLKRQEKFVRVRDALSNS